MNVYKHIAILPALIVAAPVMAAESAICQVSPSTVAQTAASNRSFPVDRELGYGTFKISDGVFIGSDGNASMGIVVTDNGVVLFDAPSTMGAVIETMVAQITNQPITHVIYSHAHADHIGGAHNLTGTFEVIASAETAAELEKFDRPDSEHPFGVFVGGSGSVPVPTNILDGSLTRTIDGREFVFETLQTGHSDGELIAFLPGSKTLMATDITWPASVPWVRLGDADNVPGYMAQNAHLLTYDFDHLIAGHFAMVGNRSDVENNLAYLTDLRAASVNALQTTNAGEIAQETGITNAYELMDIYFQRTVDSAAEPTIAKWRDRLQGTGVWGCQHAQWMISSLRYDQAAEEADRIADD